MLIIYGREFISLKSVFATQKIDSLTIESIKIPKDTLMQWTKKNLVLDVAGEISNNLSQLDELYFEDTDGLGNVSVSMNLVFISDFKLFKKEIKKMLRNAYEEGLNMAATS